MHFGELLKRFREERQFTLRDLGTLSKLDHAYISRLERGDKTAPSDETVQRLTRALRLDTRKGKILRLLIQQSAPKALVELVLDENEHAIADCRSLIEMSVYSHREKSKARWKKIILMIRDLRHEIERDK